MIRLGGDKMSKSKGNLVAPEEILDREGADALRLAHLFVGPPQDYVDWEGVGIEGSARFLHRLWRLATGEARAADPVDREPTAADDAIDKATHRLIARVTDEYERWSYNTAVAAFMEFTQRAVPLRPVRRRAPRRDTLDFAIDTLLLLMAPMAPHVTAELWRAAARRRARPRTALAGSRSRHARRSTPSPWSCRSTARSATSSRFRADIDEAEAQRLAPRVRRRCRATSTARHPRRSSSGRRSWSTSFAEPASTWA